MHKTNVHNCVLSYPFICIDYLTKEYKHKYYILLYLNKKNLTEIEFSHL